MRQNQLNADDRIAYELLLSECADHVGDVWCGKPSLEQMPQLKPADIALICRNFQVDVMDCLADEIDLTPCAADIEAHDFCALGAYTALAIERACRRAVAYDVMCVLETRQIAEDREAQEVEWVRGPLEESL